MIHFHQLDQDTYLQVLENHHAQEIKDMIDENRAHLEQWIERFKSIRTLTEVSELIGFCSGSQATNKSVHPGIWYQGKFVGVVGLHMINWQHKRTNIGAWLAKDAEGKGLAKKALTFLINYAFNELSLNRLDSNVAVENIKSVKMCLSLGFQKEGIIRKSEIVNGKALDCYHLGLLREEWLVRKELISHVNLT